MSSLLRCEHRRIADSNDVFGSANDDGRICRNDLISHQPVEAHPDGSQVLLDSRLGGWKILNVIGDVD